MWKALYFAAVLFYGTSNSETAQRRRQIMPEVWSWAELEMLTLS